MSLTEKEKRTIRLICEAAGVIVCYAWTIGEITREEYDRENAELKKLYDYYLQAGIRPQAGSRTRWSTW